jgi:ABC-type multidrug transport system permease subunit
LLFIAVVHGAINTIFLYENRLATSFPLWSAFALVGIFYAIPLFILLSVFLVFSILYARRMRAEKLDSR